MRAFAVASASRSANAPEIPTTDEAGFPGLYMSSWYGFFAPKGTPGAVIDKLSSAVSDALSDPQVRQRLADNGQEIPDARISVPRHFGHGRLPRSPNGGP